MLARSSQTRTTPTLARQLARGFSSLASAVNRLRNRLANRLAYREIQELDDYQLYDIGLSRDDLRAANRLPKSVDPIAHLAAARHRSIRGQRHR